MENEIMLSIFGDPFGENMVCEMDNDSISEMIQVLNELERVMR